MPAETNLFAPTNTFVGGMPLTSVDQLCRPQQGQPPSTTPPAAKPAPSAGVNQQMTTAKSVHQSLFGRSASNETVATPAGKPAASTKAKDLGPEIAVNATTAFGGEGLLTQAGVSATFKLDERTSVSTTVRERLKDFSQSGKPSVLDTRVSAQVKIRAVDEPKVKFDLSLEGYGQFNQPLGGGDASIQLGLRQGFGLSYLPTKDFSLGLNGYADLSRTLPSGSDSIVVGGDVNAALKFGDGFKFTAGVRAESPNLLEEGGTPSVVGFGILSKQVNEHFSFSAEVIGGFVGKRTLSTSFVSAGEVGGVFKATYTF
jgi:hypothetical protein